MALATAPDTERSAPTATEILQGWHRTAQRFVNSRARGLACHNLRHNLSIATIPDTWGTREDREQIAACLPERQLVEQGIVNSLSEYWPVYRRQAIGTPTSTKERAAGALERWLEGCDEEQVDHDLQWLKAGEDGEYAYLLLPDLADIQAATSYSDEITDKEYRALAERARAGWQRDGSSGRYRRPKPAYWRDERGRPTDDYTRRSARASRRAYEQHINTSSKRLPWVERLISMYDCAPVLTRGRGKKRYECRALYVRTLYDVDELRGDGWQWIDMDHGLVPRGYSSTGMQGANQQLYLYEYYYVDRIIDERSQTIEDHPCVAYTIGGQGTDRHAYPRDDDQCATVDLYEHFGIDEPCWDYFYAMHTGADDPDFIGRPLLWPLVATITNLEKIVTAKNAFDWDSGLNGYVMPMDPQMSPAMEAAVLEGTEFKTFERPLPGELAALPGPVVPFVSAEASRGISENIAFHADRLQRNKPQETPGERASGASGNAMLVTEDLKQQAHRHLRECIRQTHEFAGRTRILFACAFKRKFGVDVPVEANIEHSTTDSPQAGEARGLLEFDERWVGDVYRITSEFPAVGNLAEVSQFADLYDRGLVTFPEVREKLGDTDPENTRVKLRVEAYYKSPEGMMRLDMEVAKIMNDQEKLAMLEAQLNGQVNEQGIPPGAIPPELRGAPPGMGPAPPGEYASGLPPMPGTQLPDIPGSVLGGVIAGEMGTASAMANARTQAAVPGGG